MSRHLQVVLRVLRLQSASPRLPSRPSSSVKSCQLDLQLYAEITPCLHPHRQGPSSPFFSVMWQPHSGAQVLKIRNWPVSSCSSEPTSQSLTQGCGIQSEGLGFTSGTLCSNPGAAPTCCATPSVSTPPPTTPLSAVPGSSPLGRMPGLLQASLPFHASLCPNVHPQLLGHPRR